VLALGFYITPMLVGGGGDQMISYFVAFYTNESVNWGMAAALGSWLLLFVMALFLVLGRAVGTDRMRIG
jgi:putative spermidine/putrescine transport system permease protein